MEKSYKLPAICWLKVTDYLHGWLQYELGGEARVKDKRVVCIQHLPGARALLRMETEEESMEPKTVDTAMSGTMKNCIESGLLLDVNAVKDMYGMTKEQLQLYVPIECPPMCMTSNGVLRQWNNNVCFGRKQARAIQKLLFREFWKAVATFDREYAQKMNGEKYPAKDMVEEFCEKTETPSYHVDTIRREWMRQRVKVES